MFPDAYPSYVNDFLDCLERFLRRFRECIHEVNQVNNAVRRRKADGKACLQCLINYRDSFMNMIAPLYEMLNIKPSSKWQNPVYVTMKKCKDEERTAAELYHNCDEKLLNESLIYLHSESELQKHIPLGYFAAHIDDVLPKYNESQLIAELYCYYGLECTLQSFYDDYSSCRKSIGKPVTVKYKAVDKAKNAKHKNNYAKQIDAVAKTYSVVKQQNNVEVSISHPDYPHSFTAM